MGPPLPEPAMPRQAPPTHPASAPANLAVSSEPTRTRPGPRTRATRANQGPAFEPPSPVRPAGYHTQPVLFDEDSMDGSEDSMDGREDPMGPGGALGGSIADMFGTRISN